MKTIELLATSTLLLAAPAGSNTAQSMQRRQSRPPRPGGRWARLAGAALAAITLVLPALAGGADLPVKDGLMVWLKADAVDSSDTNQVRLSGSDILIKQWKDQSGNNHPASNTTDTEQPLYVAGALNGLPVLRFFHDGNDDGIGDRLFLGDLGVYSANAGSIFVVATINGDGRYNLFGNRNGADERWVADTWGESRPGSWRVSRSTHSSFTQSDWPTYGSHVFSLESSRSVFRVVIDGDEIGSDTADYHSGAGSDWTIGNRSTDGQPLQGDIAEVIIYNHTLRAEEADQVGYYLATKYGVTTTYTGSMVPQARIYDFALPGNPAIINGTNITLTVPFGTSASALAPTYILSVGATCDKASGSTQNFMTPQTYTVRSSDGATTNAYLVTLIVRPPAVTYDFNTGLQGWTQIWPTNGSSAVLWQNSALGSGYDQDDPYSRFGRSPAFILHGLEDLTFQLSGGHSPLATPAVPSAVPERAINGGGFTGVALRDIATDTYVLWKSRNGDGGDWQTGRFTTNELAPFAIPGKKYTLDYMDYNLGGWGWTYMDNVAIPGYGTTLSLEAAETAISLGVPGSTITAVLKIPQGFNQYAAATVYVTNSNPGALTINGSADPVYAVTFPMLGANTANLTLAGTAAGTSLLRAHTSGLDDASVTITVAPPLIGRWVSGAANLTDASGYRPAGTHDGVAVGTTANLAYSAEVPPGCTGQSLDLRAGNVGVMINNSATTDAGYLNTFDDVIRNKFTVAFWAKGFPGNWNGWVSKRGEGGIGWQLRRMGGDPIAGFTLRGVDNDDGWGSSINVNDNNWHHYVGVWNQATGTRTLYIDGVLSHVVNNTVGQMMNMAAGKHLGLGAREQGGAGFESYFSGLLYDVQMFSYPLSQAEARALIPAAIRLTGRPAVMVTGTSLVTVSIPVGANTTSAVTVQIANSQPSKVTVDGSAATVSVVFAPGATNSQTVTLAGVSPGFATLTATATGMASATLTVQAYAYTGGVSGLIGHWLAGAPHLADVSGYYLDGTHDGSFIGVPPTTQFTNDLPLGRSGSALDLRGAPNVAVRIDRSRQTDTGYQPTFDNGIYSKFTVAFWAKGFPGNWNPWVSKYGENNGWQLRRNGGGSVACLTVRGQPNEDGGGSNIGVNDNNWHHFVGVWDGENGNRSLYVDGVLSHTITGGYAPMNQAPAAHLALGARGDESDNYGNWFKGLLYDVRLYSSALTSGDVVDLVGAILVSPTSLSLVSPSPNTNLITLVVPPSIVATSTVNVVVTSDKPGVATPVGAVAGVLTVPLPMGGTNSASFAVQANGPGTAHFTYTCSSLQAAATTTIAVQQPNISGLVGFWNFDNQTLVETSGFQPAGTHDGVAVGTVAYVPGRLGGYAVDLRAANSAVRIKNSLLTDADYRNTYDGFLFNSAAGFSFSCWVKGLPLNEWSSWIAKDGEATGYAIRRNGNSDQISFTLRNSDSADDVTSATARITDNLWHHVTAVYDPVNLQRRLYLDGVETISITDSNLTLPPMNSPLFFGARDSSGDARFAQVIVDEIKAYDKVLSVTEIAAQVGSPLITLTPGKWSPNLGDPDLTATITVPASLVATSAVNVTLTSANPAVASPVGAVGGSLTVNFPMGGANTASVAVHATGIGATTVSGTSPSSAVNGEIAIAVTATPVLIGHWLSGAANLSETSGYRPAGTHDGFAVGANAGALNFSYDVPADFTGQSLDLSVGTVGVLVTNSANWDAGYKTTFDTDIAAKCSIAFWAKGMPGQWAGWVTKFGENGKGLQLRRMGNGNNAGFTIRGIDNDDGTGSGINVNDGNWHHYVGIWDQAAGTRTLYVDGAFSHVVRNNPSQVMSQAPGAHLLFGALQDENGNYWGDRWVSCLLFDVRIYNAPVSEGRIQSMQKAVVVQPVLTIQPSTGNQVRIAWPTTFTGYSIQQSSTLTGGWGLSGLTVNVEGSEYAAYAPATGSPQFFRLTK